METVEARKKYGLKTKFRYIAGFMGIYNNDPVCEFEESIVETNTMSFDKVLEIILGPGPHLTQLCRCVKHR